MVLEECKNLGLIDRNYLIDVSQETAKELTHPCPNSHFLAGLVPQEYNLSYLGGRGRRITLKTYLGYRVSS